MEYKWSTPSQAVRKLLKDRAGDGDRTRDVQLGESAFAIVALTPVFNQSCIEPGNLADFVVFSKHYLRVPEDDTKDIEAKLTVMDGRVVYGDEAR